MVTVADVLRTAKEVTDAGLIYREPSGYFSAQQQPPYPPNHFGRSWIESCGVGTAFVLHRAGLRVPDMPPFHAMQYAPSLRRYANSTPRVGAIGVFNWRPGDGVLDHIVLIVGGERVDAQGFVHGAVDVWECNWDRTLTSWYARGVPRYARHPRHYFEVCVMPRYATTTAPTPEPPLPPTTTNRREPGGDVILYKVPMDSLPAKDPKKKWNTFIDNGAMIDWYNPDYYGQVDNPTVVWLTERGWQRVFSAACIAYHGQPASVVLAKKCGCLWCTTRLP